MTFCLLENFIYCKENLKYCLVFYQKGVYRSNDLKYKSKFYVSPTTYKEKREFKHPTIKPLELVKRHILNSSKKGDIILDPFIGSGTTAVACKSLKRNYIGFEIDKEYYDIAINRLEDKNIENIKSNVEQLRLF